MFYKKKYHLRERNYGNANYNRIWHTWMFYEYLFYVYENLMSEILVKLNMWCKTCLHACSYFY